jgi:HK97 family phage portal protein
MFIYGEALWVKVRGRDGKPAELWPLHPGNVYTRNNPDGELEYYFYVGASSVPEMAIPSRDIVHFRSYNPDTTVRGMSPLEPLRQTLVNEDAARRATTAFWNNGARPGGVLTHPKQLSQDAGDRLRTKWEHLNAGTDKTGRTVVLEEGMKFERVMLNAEESQYIETRKLAREEACALYDVPPPVVHILDHATFSNITEQMRSMYRDTMAPRLGLFESVVDMQLRPEFDAAGNLYAEFLMDEVLRGDFEVRANAYQAAINSGWMQPAEVRSAENLPPVDGADRLFVNATLIPIDEVSQHTSPALPALDLPDEQQPPAIPAVATEVPKSLPSAVARKVAARASRCDALEDIDPDALTAGLNGSTRMVLTLLGQSKQAGDDVSTFCALVWALAKE